LKWAKNFPDASADATGIAANDKTSGERRKSKSRRLNSEKNIAAAAGIS